MFPIDRVSVLLRAFPRNHRSRVGGNPPRPVGPPLQGGDRKNSPPWRGAASAAGWVPPARQTTPSASHLPHFTRFLTCRRGAVALESAIAVIPLVICLVGVFEIVQSVFVRDLLQRATYRTAYANALREYAATDDVELRNLYSADLKGELCEKGEEGEVCRFLNFEIKGEGSCSETPPQNSPPVDFCLCVSIDVYDKPSDMLNGTASKGGNAALGGDTGDMVVVTVVAMPQSVLSELWQVFSGEPGDSPSCNGLTATAVRRNERIDAV